MTPDIVARYVKLYSDCGLPRGPRPDALTRRLIEEAVELHLAAGGWPIDCYAAVGDALTNEAKKHGHTVPSTMAPSFAGPHAVASEVADITTILAVLTEYEDIAGSDILGEANVKIGMMELARERGDLRVVDGRLYRRYRPPAPERIPGML